MINRHPVDRLADVRAEMRELKEREEQLRNEILRGECGLEGDEFEARIMHSDHGRVSLEAIKQKMGLEWMKGFIRLTSVVSIKLRKREALDDAYQD